MKTYLFLALAILLEIFASTMLKASNQFTKVVPTVLLVVGYVCSFYFLSLTLKEIPMGIAYAIWSGAGIVLLTVIGYFVFKQNVDLPAMIGIGLIVLGVIVINVFSKSTAH